MFDFWLAMGVDGLRLDAIPYLFEREGTNCENLPETHAFLKELRAHISAKYPDVMLLAEACQWPEDVVAYFGDGDSCHMAFHFPVMPRLFMALQMEDRYPVVDIMEQTPSIPANCQWAIFLRNHDELTLEMVTDEERDYMYRMFAADSRMRINLGIRRRLAPLLGNNRRKIELINILLFSLPGTPIIYYGDEIAMGDNIYLGDRNGVRTPMQWSADRNAGFSRANPQQLYFPIIIDPEYHYESINVENQEQNLSSLLNWMRRVTATRRRFQAFGRGTMEFLTSDNTKVLTFLRRHEDEIILVVVNLSRFSQAVELDLSAFAGMRPREIFSQNKFPQVREDQPYTLTVGPHGHFWLLLEATAASLALESPERSLPLLEGVATYDDLLKNNVRAALQGKVLPAYLPHCRWFRSKARTIQRTDVRRVVPVGNGPTAARLLWVDVFYTEGLPETYALPLQILPAEGVKSRRSAAPTSPIAALADGGALCDASADETFQRDLLSLVAGGRQVADGTRGALVGLASDAARGGLSALGDEVPCRALGVEQSNTSVVYKNEFFLKLYRKVEEGENPDIELTRFLTEQAGFPNVPPYAGQIEYRPADRKQPTEVLALMQSWVASEGDAWTLTQDSASRFFERVLAARHTPNEAAPETSPHLLENDFHIAPQNIQEIVGGIYPSRAELLGQRTGELHLALSGDAARAIPAMAPEPFTMLYQRALEQSVGTLTRRVFTGLRRKLPTLPEAMQADVSRLLDSQKTLSDLVTQALRGRIDAMKIRVHGDYHLGQVLFTGKDFSIIDFEGEPARSIGERKLKRSPLADVAGMLRSFHYAISSALFRRVTSAQPEDTPLLQAWADTWYAYVAGSFLRAYVQTTAPARLAPADPAAFERLLQAFLLEKAVYEVGYEMNNRPDWLAIPIRGIFQVLGPAMAAVSGGNGVASE